MRKPRVLTKCVANYYASPNERIVEFSHGDKSGLISFRAMNDGSMLVTVYRTDAGITVKHLPDV